MLPKLAGIFILSFLSFLPSTTLNAQVTSAGFVPSNIWYSSDTFEEGDKIQIHTFVFNPDARELSGTMSFYDSAILLGKKPFTVSPNSAEEVSIDWVVTAGEHKIFAKIEGAKFLVSKGNYETALLQESETVSLSRTVNKKIILKPEEESVNIVEEVEEKLTSTLDNITKVVEESTPSVISTPVKATLNTLEQARKALATSSEQGKVAAKLKIQEVKASNESKSYVDKPFNYVKLFFLTIIAFFAKYSIAFYSLVLVILFYILRYLYRLVF